ncbi:MAG: GMC family oxidoreductase [Myxococcales bacterium]|nr:GMC family oxidoreductase [Myxococcales bacterium]
MSAPDEIWDAIVIGSGFGGSINALRLAEAGRSVLVLERGRRYRPGEFPRDVRKVDNLLWRYPKHSASTGLYDVRFHSGIGTVAAAGVGGGSLIYANIHYRPNASVFDDPRWPTGIDASSLEPYYRRVAEKLGVSPFPAGEFLPKRDIFRKTAEALGREPFDVPQAVSWNEVQGAAKAGRRPCQRVAECEFGCNFGSKNSLDFNYLAEAEALGAVVEPERQVSHIEPDAEFYRVHYRDIIGEETRTARARRVVVAAGTLGTVELLLRSRDLHKTLPRLPATLGHGYSGNGDFLGSIQNIDRDIEPWGGPDVTTIAWYHDRLPGFVLAAPTFNQEVMEVLASLGQGAPPALLKPLAPLLWKALPWLLPLAFKSGLLSKPLRLPGPNAGPAERMTNLFAIGSDDAQGRMHLRNGALDIDWDYTKSNSALIARQEQAMRDFAEKYGGTYAPIATYALFRKILTVHNLGGCHIADAPERGVVDTDGQVFGHRGLYVADGSVIPTAIGSHPVMTIAALAERIAERVVASYGSTRKPAPAAAGTTELRL